MDITVYITSSLTSSERRVSPQWSVQYLKTKMYPITGVEPKDQQLYLYPIAKSNERVELNDDEATLAHYNVQDFMRIHVKSTADDSVLQELENSTYQDKFQLSPEEYANRPQSVMAWKKQNLYGRFGSDFESKKRDWNLKLDEKLASLIVGQNCRVENDNLNRSGVIRFIGPIPQIDNKVWCGVEWDQPLGKNDGSIKGARYFTCPENHGSFVNPLTIIDLVPVESSDDEL